MQRKIRPGMDIFLILILVFFALGTVYVMMGWGLAQSADPEEHTTGAMFVPLGLALLAAAGVLGVLGWLRIFRAQKLVEEGRYVRCQITSVRPVYAVRVNRRNPYVVRAVFWDGTGKEHRFDSWASLKYHDQSLVGKHVRVYIRDNTYQNYYMDVDELLP